MLYYKIEDKKQDKKDLFSLVGKGDKIMDEKKKNQEEKILCFKIEDKELFLDEVLIENDHIPTLFACKDNEESLYLSLYFDEERDIYWVFKTEKEKLIQFLEEKIPFGDFLENEEKWTIHSGEKIEEDMIYPFVYKPKDFEKGLGDYRFKIATEKHQKYLELLS